MTALIPEEKGRNPGCGYVGEMELKFSIINMLNMTAILASIEKKFAGF